jgi:hypothetical protein
MHCKIHDFHHLEDGSCYYCELNLKKLKIEKKLKQLSDELNDNTVSNSDNSGKLCLAPQDLETSALGGGQKPPLGAIPKKYWLEDRFHEICRAISEYYNAGLEIKQEWIDEYNEYVGSRREA